MSDATQVIIPLINPNEPQALVIELHILEGQHVSPGDLLCTLETTKSTSDVVAETEGYVVGLACEEGQQVTVGDLFCFLADSPDWSPPVSQTPVSASSEEDAIPHGLRITQPALTLAKQSGFDLSGLPAGPLVTESFLRSRLRDQSASIDQQYLPSHIDSHTILVYGGGGHGKSVIDLLKVLNTYSIAGIIDDGLAVGDTVMGFPVFGGSETLQELFNLGVRLVANAVGGIGDIHSRIKVSTLLVEIGFKCPTIIHPSAFVESSAKLAEGIQVFPHAYIGSETEIGFGVIVNTGSIISHDCALDDHVNISPGTMLAGGVHIGANTLVGMGVTINLNATIGTRVRIGNGATIKDDVPDGIIVQAGRIWPA
jgi:sugar O-acyltransferase (sialic acid O-acetyltransferase NeuD family)